MTMRPLVVTTPAIALIFVGLWSFVTRTAPGSEWRSVWGTVLDEAERPLSGVTISVYVDGKQKESTETAADGSFIVRVPKDKATVVVASEIQPMKQGLEIRRATVAPVTNSEKIEITFPAKGSATIIGRLVFAQGVNWTDVRVQARRVGDYPFVVVASTFARADGNFTLGPLAPGEYRIDAFNGPLAALDQKFVVPAGAGELELNITLVPRPVRSTVSEAKRAGG